MKLFNKISRIDIYLWFLLLFVASCFFYVLIFKIIFKFNFGIGSYPDYFNIIALYITALVILQYTMETKRLADYEKIQVLPIIGHTIQVRFIEEDRYEIIPTIVNHSKFPVTAKVYLSLIYALDTKLELVNSIDSLAYNGKRDWKIPPYGAFQGHLNISSKLTKFTNETKEINITKNMFADNLEIKIRYDAICKQSGIEFISDEYPYKFRLIEASKTVDLIPELVCPDSEK